LSRYRLAYYRDLLAASAYVDYVYRFEHEKDEARKKPTSKSEALEALGEWLWQTPERTGTLNYKDGGAAAAGAAWSMLHCLLQANMLFFFRDAAATSSKPEGVLFLKASKRDKAKQLPLTFCFFFFFFFFLTGR
jgi:hypothetical protein